MMDAYMEQHHPNVATKRPKEKPEEPRKKQKSTVEGWPKAETNWEEELDFVKTIERVDGSSTRLRVWLIWKNGEKTIASNEEVRLKCPQKLLDFYESRVKFRHVDQE
jgi:chromobox protein 1